MIGPITGDCDVFVGESKVCGGRFEIILTSPSQAGGAHHLSGHLRPEGTELTALVLQQGEHGISLHFGDDLIFDCWVDATGNLTDRAGFYALRDGERVDVVS